jgi:hypothetical protein
VTDKCKPSGDSHTRHFQNAPSKSPAGSTSVTKRDAVTSFQADECLSERATCTELRQTDRLFASAVLFEKFNDLLVIIDRGVIQR